MTKRLFDLVILFLMLPISLPLVVVVSIAVRLSSGSPVLYWSNRIGTNNIIFKMPKFRTMILEAPTLATHLIADPRDYLTPVGSILRKTSLDELPQLWSILIGDMSFVGPRPALFNQDDLITLRSQNGIDKLTPGLTGWAQVNGRDDLPVNIKIMYDIEYSNKQSIFFDVKILFLTLIRVVLRSGVSH